MDRDETLYNYAERCAKKYYELAKDGKVAGLTQHDRKLLEEGKAAFVDWYADAMRNKLAASPEYSEENWDDKKAERLEKMKEYDGINFLLYDGKSPEQSHEEAEFAKFKELVEDGAWYRMSPGAISAWAGEKGGYDWGSKADRDRFWNDLSKFDIMYNRARNIDEFANSGWGKVNAVLNRTAYKEAVEQALGDKPYNRADVLTGFGIDRGRDVLMAPAMGMGGVIKPALAIGAADLYTQGASAFGLGQRLSPEETLSSMGAGVTVVPGFQYGTKWLSRAKNPSVAKFGVEMNRGARNYVERDYVTEEANALKQGLLDVRKEQQAIRDGKLSPGTPQYDAAMERLNEMEDKLRVLGFNGTEFRIDDAASEAQNLGAARSYIAAVLNGNFMNTPPGKGISIPTMLGYNGGTADEALQTLEQVYRAPGTYNVSRPTLEQMATYRAARMLGIEPNKAVYRPEFLSKAEQKAISRAEQAQLENAETIAELDQILQQGATRRSALRQFFPAMSKRLEGEDAPKGRTAGSVVGSGLSNALGLLSGSEGLDLVAAIRAAGTIGDNRSVFQDKLDAFKQSDWYRNLPEDRKNVIEAAFKKAAEERKKKGE